MRKTVSKLRFAKHTNGHLRCERGSSTYYLRDDRFEHIIQDVKPIFGVFIFVEATWNIDHRIQTFWLRDICTLLEYPVTARFFEKMIPHFQNGLIVGVMNPTKNSGGSNTLEFIDVETTITTEVINNA